MKQPDSLSHSETDYFCSLILPTTRPGVLGGRPALVSFYPLRRSPLWALAMINVHQTKKNVSTVNDKRTNMK